MKILSSDRSSWIEIERVEDDGFVTYSVAVAIGGFSARHEAITLVGVPEFCAELAQFDRARKGEIVLEGGEDFRFVIRSLDASGHRQHRHGDPRANERMIWRCATSSQMTRTRSIGR
jgi:hypothetical protein